MRFAPLAFAIALGCASSAQAAKTKSPPEPDTYIFDVLVLQPYRGNFATLVKGKDIPDWVAAISKNGEGTAVPAKTIDVGGTPYRLDHVCKPHDCAGNTLDVLWAPGGHKVWAALVDGGKPAAMLGNPPTPQAKALADATGSATATVPTAAVPTAAAPTNPVAAAAPSPPAATPSASSTAPAATPAATPPSTAPSPEPDPYLFDLLPLQPYRSNLAALAKSKGVPDWVKAITAKGEGTAVPSKTVDIAGTPYRLDHVCKPHDCAGNTLDVLWAPGGRRVWAALVSGDKPPVLLGKPPAAQAKALTEAAASASAK